MSDWNETIQKMFEEPVPMTTTPYVTVQREATAEMIRAGYDALIEAGVPVVAYPAVALAFAAMCAAAPPPDAGEVVRRAPVQGYTPGIPWEMHLRAYDTYKKKYGKQEAMITGGCRGGFHVGELDDFIPGWRDELSDRKNLSDKLQSAEATVERLKAAYTRENDEICQTLGRALGYPRFADDQKNFPGATDENGVCVGEHVAGSIAAEVARTVERLTAQLAAAARDAENFSAALLEAQGANKLLTGELAEARAGLDSYAKTFARLEQEAAKDAAALAEAREALKPFADACDFFDLGQHGRVRDGDLRRARAALASSGDGPSALTLDKLKGSAGIFQALWEEAEKDVDRLKVECDDLASRALPPGEWRAMTVGGFNRALAILAEADARAQSAQATLAQISTLRHRPENAGELFAMAMQIVDGAPVGDGWRDMTDAPDDGRMVWTWGPQLREPEARSADGAYWRSAHYDGYRSHWMPYHVPAPPISK